jgi:hypothetical protein
LSGGLSYLVSYTRSTLKDDASSVFDASILTGPVANYPVADSFDWSRERDYSTGDIPHVFAVSGVWILPVGRGQRYSPGGVVGAIVSDWSIAGSFTRQSGVPIAVTQATNNNLFAGFGTQRPNVSGDPTLPEHERSVSRWFNTSVFSTAPQFALGNASRNPVRGPSYRNLDVALSRRVPVSAGMALEVRAEAFNVTNTPAFGAPNGSFGSPAFGTITTAADPRVIQLAVKLVFQASERARERIGESEGRSPSGQTGRSAVVAVQKPSDPPEQRAFFPSDAPEAWHGRDNPVRQTAERQ